MGLRNYALNERDDDDDDNGGVGEARVLLADIAVPFGKQRKRS